MKSQRPFVPKKTRRYKKTLCAPLKIASWCCTIVPMAPNPAMASGGSWSVYWYNGLIVSSEISRGLDIFELTPSAYLTANEIAAARTVRLDYLNAQGQPKFEWPATFALARAYADQLARSNGLTDAQIATVRQALRDAESASGAARTQKLETLAQTLDSAVSGSRDAAKVRMLAEATRALAN